MDKAINLIIGLLTLSSISLSIPIEYLQKIPSYQWGARNVISNPASLAFHRALNGLELQTSFDFFLKENKTNDLGAFFSYGSLGMGIQKVEEAFKPSFSGSFSLSDSLFLGSRLSWTHDDLDSFLSMDLGFQYRPLVWLSMGMLVTDINQPKYQTLQRPASLISGVSLNIFKPFVVSISSEMPSFSFKNVNFQAVGSLKIVEGISLEGGYQKEGAYYGGVKFTYENSSLDLDYAKTSSYHAALDIGQRSNPSVFNTPKEISYSFPQDSSETPVQPTLFSSGKKGFIDHLITLRKISENPKIKSLHFYLPKFSLGLAAAKDLYDVILELKQKGIRTTLYLENAGMKEYLIAMAFDKVVLDPTGHIELTGFKISKYHVKGLLDKLGIEPLLFAKGKYKSAPELLTQKESSQWAKQNAFEILTELEKQFLKLLKNRNIREEQWKKILSLGLIHSKEAVTYKLVDELGDWKTLSSSFSTLTPLRKVSLGLPDRIGVVVLEGDIVDKPFLKQFSKTETEEEFSQKVKELSEDARVKAIVVRVSSGGGEILTSQKMARTLYETKKIKPVYVSMGDSAASGAYLTSIMADQVYAQKFSLTGSVGVFLGKFSFNELYKKLGISKEVYSFAPLSDLYSEHSPLSEEGKKRLLHQLEFYYDDFVFQVSKERKMDKDKVENLAQGKVWLGTQAFENGLVDKTGSYLDVISDIAKLQNLSDYDLYVSLNRSSFFDSIFPNPFAYQVVLPEFLQQSLNLSTSSHFWYLSLVKIE